MRGSCSSGFHSSNTPESRAEKRDKVKIVQDLKAIEHFCKIAVDACMKSVEPIAGRIG